MLKNIEPIWVWFSILLFFGAQPWDENKVSYIIRCLDVDYNERLSVEDFKRFFVYNFNFFYQVFAIKTSNNYTISHSYVVHVFLFIYLLFIIFFECEWSLQLTFIITKEIFFFFWLY